MRTLLLLCVVALAIFTTTPIAAQSIISGTVLSQDSTAIPIAHVHLVRPSGEQVITDYAVDSTGRYRIAIDESGLFVMRFTGVHHQSFNFPLLLDSAREIQLNVLLSQIATATYPDSIQVIGKLGDSPEDSLLTLYREDDSTYRHRITSQYPEITYQLLVPSVNDNSYRTVCGTDNAFYRYDGKTYHTVAVTYDGVATIAYDPHVLPDSLISTRHEVSGVDSVYLKFVQLYNDVIERRERFEAALIAHRKAGGAIADFRYNWTTDIRNLESALQAEENDELLREMVYVSRLDLCRFGARLDSAFICQALDEVSATSPLWSLDPHMITVILEKINRDNYTSYIQEAIENHPDPKVRSLLLYEELVLAYNSNQVAKVEELYDRLLAEFPNSSLTTIAQFKYAPTRNILTGKSVPSFSFPSIDKKESYSTAGLEGKYYLLDFWATSDTQSVAERAELHTAYSRYAEKEFEIISISFDSTIAAVDNFRRGMWKMPWANALVSNEKRQDIFRQFEIEKLPQRLLVSPAGRIIATDESLHGEDFNKTLNLVFGELISSSELE